jgi:hypothetical protein
MHSRTRVAFAILALFLVVGGVRLWSDVSSAVAESTEVSSPQKPYGVDLRTFSHAGAVASDRAGSVLYDSEGYGQAGAAAFVYPPWFAVAAIPLAAVPFEVLFPLWSFAGVAALYLSVRRLAIERTFVVTGGVLMSLAGVLTLYYGQTAFLLLAILTVGCTAMARGRPYLAGVAFALATFKPHLLLGFVIWWIVDMGQRSAAVATAIIGTGLLFVTAEWWLPGSWSAWTVALNDGVHLVDLSAQVTGLAAMRLLFGDGVASAIAIAALVLAVVLAIAIRVWTSGGNLAVSVSLAVLGSLLVAPHSLAYDWVLLLLAMGFAVTIPTISRTQVSLAGLGLGASLMIGSRVTRWELSHLDRAVHIAPLLLLAMFVILFFKTQPIRRPRATNVSDLSDVVM